MAKRKLRKQPARLMKADQEMSSLQIWLWIVGGMLVLAIVFALAEVYLQ
jgi:hypothetical protein